MHLTTDRSRDRGVRKVLNKPCVWSIVEVLSSTEDRVLNITALIAKLNGNYTYVAKCLELMKSLNMVEEIHLGRLRLIKLREDSVLTKLIIDMIKSLEITS